MWEVLGGTAVNKANISAPVELTLVWEAKDEQIIWRRKKQQS